MYDETPQVKGHVGSMKREWLFNKPAVKVWLIYNNLNLKYCTLC